MTASRELRLPVWAQEMLNKLRADLANRTTEVRLLTEENQRLRNVIEEKYTDESDTKLINDDTAAELPLGNGATIEFGGIYDVRWSALTRELLIESTEDMLIQPQYTNLIALRGNR